MVVLIFHFIGARASEMIYVVILFIDFGSLNHKIKLRDDLFEDKCRN